jgi:hypothetical protein
MVSSRFRVLIFDGVIEPARLGPDKHWLAVWFSPTSVECINLCPVERTVSRVIFTYLYSFVLLYLFPMIISTCLPQHRGLQVR